MPAVIRMSVCFICFILFGLCCASDDRPFMEPDCPENLIYEKCGRGCNMTCERPYRGTCPRKCVSRCQCPLDKPILYNGRCIITSECPARTKAPAARPTPATTPNITGTLPIYFRCSGGQEFQECGSACNRTCDDGPDYATCNKACVARCGCPSTKPYWHEDKCITYDQCSKVEESVAVRKDRQQFYDWALKHVQEKLKLLGIKLITPTSG